MKKFSNLKKTFIQNENNSFDADDLVDNNKEKTSDDDIKVEDNKILKSEPSKFFSKLFESREMAHIYHLQVNGNEGSFAAHKALNDYYVSILELIDEMIEIYQGQYDIIEGYDIIDTSSTKNTDKLNYFIDLSKFIKDTRYMAILEEDTHLQNIIDECVALIYKTIYKLKFNK